MRVLHLAPHLGGGVGRFLANVVAADDHNQHEFCLLESPIDTHLLAGLTWNTIDRLEIQLDAYLAEFDVVQIEFWNHPALFKFLIDHPLPPSRLIVYAHVSGIYAPNLIPQAIFDIADKVVLSTPAARAAFADEIRRQRCCVIHEIGGIARTSEVHKAEHDRINIAYVGTASHAKLHPGFIQACWTLTKRLPSIQFTVASNDNALHLQAESASLGIDKHFSFLYRTNDVADVLSRADLFGYPLRPDHFGTGEQALLEAMGAGVAPVVLNNPAESSLVKDGDTGVIAADIHDYVGAVQYCIEHADFAHKLGDHARAFALANFSVDRTVAQFQALYEWAVQRSKRARRFLAPVPAEHPELGWACFKLCLGDHPDIVAYENASDEMERDYYRDKISRSVALMSDRKGGLGAYRRYFPVDGMIRRFYESGPRPPREGLRA